MSNIPIGLQLFSVRGECRKDLFGALRSVAEVGYVGVEPFGYRGEEPTWLGKTGLEIRAVLDDLGLTCCGMHLATQALLGDNLKRTIELNRELGNRFLIVAAEKQRMSSMDGIREFAGILNETAAALEPEGMWTGYHAHSFDFGLVEGRQAWYHLFDMAEESIIMQLDVGNSASGGGDPVDILRIFPGRARSMHLKDYGFEGERGVIGEGAADWSTIFELCDTTQPVEWYVVEEGGADGMGFDVCARSLANLRGMGR